MNKVTTVAEAVSHLKDGDTLFVGGFLQCGSPETLLAELIRVGTKHLTAVNNDFGIATTNMVKVFAAGQVDKTISSFLGMNPCAEQKQLDEPQNVTLVPQGTLAERIRAGGAGIRGFYTPVGVGTPVEVDKEHRMFDRMCLLELPLHANVAFVHASVVDKSGNCFLRGSTKNFNVVMATAADYVIVEAEQIVEVGEIDPELVTIPGVYINAIVPVEV